MIFILVLIETSIIQGFRIVVVVIKVHPSDNSSVGNGARYRFVVGGRYFKAHTLCMPYLGFLLATTAEEY